MMDLRELYQEVIIDHNKNPRNHHSLAHATHQAQGYNPLCGDKISVYVNLIDDRLQEVCFMGCGCAISQASASLMTEAMQGKSVAEAHELFAQFHQMLTQEGCDISSINQPKLAVLAGVRTFPARVKCATLAWHTLEAALKHNSHTVVTE